MFCPRCSTQNSDDAKFCRSCGANLSLVLKALTGDLADATGGRKHRDHPGSSLAFQRGITKTFMGLGFLVLSVVLLFTRQFWGVWLLIPAFALLGNGIARIVSARPQPGPSGNRNAAISPPEDPARLPSSGFTRPSVPPSVTENTTKHLEPEPRRSRDAG